MNETETNTNGIATARSSEPVDTGKQDALFDALAEAEQSATVAVEKRRAKTRPAVVEKPARRRVEKDDLPESREPRRADAGKIDTARKTIGGLVAGGNSGLKFVFQHKCERAELPPELVEKIVARVPLSDEEQARLTEIMVELADKWGLLQYVGPELGGFGVLAPWVLSLFFLWREIDRLEQRPAAPAAPEAVAQ